LDGCDEGRFTGSFRKGLKNLRNPGSFGAKRRVKGND